MLIDAILKHANKILFCLVFAPVIFITAFIGIYIYIFRAHDISSNAEHWGQFGDYVGGLLNPTLALCAFLALVLAVILQRKELSDARSQFSKTASTLNRQTNDNTFFEMLSLHSQNVESIRIDKKKLLYINGKALRTEGREAFVEMLRCLGLHLLDVQKISKFTTEEDLIRVTYHKFFENFQSSLAHYFRYLYNIVRFIDTLPIDTEDKLFYGKLVRAQMSNHELAILYFNCLSPKGKDNFKPLVEKYALLKHLPPELIQDGSLFFKHYSKEAWGENHDYYKKYHSQVLQKYPNLSYGFPI